MASNETQREEERGEEKTGRVPAKSMSLGIADDVHIVLCLYIYIGGGPFTAEGKG